MISKDTHYGGSKHRSISADGYLSLGLGRYKVVTPSTSGLSLYLPAANITPIRAGGPAFYIYNAGAHDMTLKDSAGSTVGTLTAGKSCLVVLADDTTAAGEWYMDCDTPLATGTTTASTTAPPTTTTAGGTTQFTTTTIITQDVTTVFTAPASLGTTLHNRVKRTAPAPVCGGGVLVEEGI